MTREQIERIRDGWAATGWLSTDDANALFDHALSEQSRIDAAVAKGLQAGIEKAARWHADQAAAIDERIAKRGQVEFVSGLGRVACLHRQFATDMLAALTPTPTTEEGA